MPAPSAPFYLCSRAREAGVFGVFDRKTEDAKQFASERAARDFVEQTYPGAFFALTTMAKIYGPAKNPTVMPDIVVIAVLVQPGDVNTAAVAAYVFGAVHGPTCIPFTEEVWPDLRDHLPRHRRGKN